MMHPPAFTSVNRRLRPRVHNLRYRVGPCLLQVKTLTLPPSRWIWGSAAVVLIS
jgi:hypothetical protein